MNQIQTESAEEIALPRSHDDRFPMFATEIDTRFFLFGLPQQKT
jgi:hypothetical protein